MLPFLKTKKADSGIATVYRAPDEDKESEKSEESSGLEAAMQDFCHAHEARDYKGMAQAFRNAFDMLEAAPHHEDEHLE